MSCDDLARDLRDEAYHLRVVTRELRNRSQTLARAYDESLGRIELLISQFEDPHAKEAQGDRNGSTAVPAG